jgi:hypothetical protein
MRPGSSICELCEFEEAHPCSPTVADQICAVCEHGGEVQAVDIRGEELPVCRSCKQDYFAVPGPIAAC